MKKRVFVLLFAAIIMTWSAAASAAEVLLPVSVNLISCGETKADLPRACAADHRCCVFLQPQQLAALDTPDPQIIDLSTGATIDEPLPLYSDPATPHQLYTE